MFSNIYLLQTQGLGRTKRKLDQLQLFALTVLSQELNLTKSKLTYNRASKGNRIDLDK